MTSEKVFTKEILIRFGLLCGIFFGIVFGFALVWFALLFWNSKLWFTVGFLSMVGGMLCIPFLMDNLEKGKQARGEVYY